MIKQKKSRKKEDENGMKAEEWRKNVGRKFHIKLMNSLSSEQKKKREILSQELKLLIRVGVILFVIRDVDRKVFKSD